MAKAVCILALAVLALLLVTQIAVVAAERPHVDDTDLATNLDSNGRHLLTGEVSISKDKIESIVRKSIALVKKIHAAKHPESSSGRRLLTGKVSFDFDKDKIKSIVKQSIALVKKIHAAKHPESSSGRRLLTSKVSIDFDKDKIESIVKKSINFAKKLKAKHHPIEFSKSVDIRVAKKGVSVKIGKSG